MDDYTKTVTVINLDDKTTIITDATQVLFSETWITVYRISGSIVNFKTLDVRQITEEPNVR